VFERSPIPRATSAPSKESLLRQADQFRALARRARRLGADVTDEEDRRQLVRHIAELEGNAARLEKAAIDAKSG